MANRPDYEEYLRERRASIDQILEDGAESALKPEEEWVPFVDGWVTPPIGHVFWPREGIACTVIGEPVPADDLFGRGMRNVLIRINDTGEEGWYMYGPRAYIFDIKER